jgi:hypothetical protein
MVGFVLDEENPRLAVFFEDVIKIGERRDRPRLFRQRSK